MCTPDLERTREYAERRLERALSPQFIIMGFSIPRPESVAVDPLGRDMFKGKTIPVPVYSVRAV